jgi:hypothetical protein|tara:strand:+ start:162 stop:797 length:636 start_codon:yes stop_codon:yes gene_type:complete
MKLLLENWREYLNEGMKSPADIPDYAYVAIEVTGEGFVDFYYADKEGNEAHHYPTGLITIRQPTERKGTAFTGGKVQKDGTCSGAWILAGSEASRGWGPLLYDVAIEWASINGKGLTPDRHTVSAQARAVWDYYLNKRGDVKDYQLDDLENTLTNTEDDNCEQRSAHDDYSDVRDHWQVSPLSKKYTKAPTTIAQLEKMGKLIDRTKTPKL